VALSLEEANPRNTTTVKETRAEAGAAVAELIEREERPSRSRSRRCTWVGSERVVADNGDQTGPRLQPIQACEVRTYIPGAWPFWGRSASARDCGDPTDIGRRVIFVSLQGQDHWIAGQACSFEG
jgi:hypothetical protein